MLASPHLQPLSPGDPSRGADTGVVGLPILQDQDFHPLSQHGGACVSGSRGAGDQRGRWRAGAGGDAVGVAAECGGVLRHHCAQRRERVQEAVAEGGAALHRARGAVCRA